jgi:hypothetical protein
VRTTSCFIFCSLLAAHAASAQPVWPHVELWGGVTFSATSVDSTLTTSYVPLIDRYSAPLPGSVAGQAINVLGDNPKGLGGGVNLFFSRHVGVQFLLDRDTVDLTGAAANYNVLLNYTAMQPPDYVARSYSNSSTFTPCDASNAWGCVRPTTGSFRQTTLGFNLVGRWRAGGRANVGLSGGLSYADLRGHAQPLRYTLFEMGGHSTLFSEQYQLAYSVGPVHGIGFNVGGSFDVRLGRCVAVTADARYVRVGNLAAPLVVTDLINKDTVIFVQDQATIQATLHPPALSLAPSRARRLLGLKILM